MSKDNVVSMFSDKSLIQFLEETLEKAREGTVTHMVSILGDKENTGFAIIGLETLKDVTEMIGNLQLVQTHLTLNLIEDMQGG
jgi:hypothetical protein